MPVDLSMELIHATVQLEQPQSNGTRTVGTGFLISEPAEDGTPRTILVTANHVLNRMPGSEMRIGFRIQNPDGSWVYAPQSVIIRQDGRELWTHHATRDVAVLRIVAPPEFTRAAIPMDWLASDTTFQDDHVTPGDEMLTLGFPRGLSSNTAGFPILRSGRVASFPLTPASAYPTFLLDFSVFPGNSGGPVYVSAITERREPSEAAPAQFIAGILTEQVELNSERLGIGVVTHASYVRETIALLDASQSEPAHVFMPTPVPAIQAATAGAGPVHGSPPGATPEPSPAPAPPAKPEGDQAP